MNTTHPCSDYITFVAVPYCVGDLRGLYGREPTAHLSDFDGHISWLLHSLFGYSLLFTITAGALLPAVLDFTELPSRGFGRSLHCCSVFPCWRCC
jgi:hypothetical protein